MSYLITGGLGYIGSHIAVELLNQGKSVIIVDNLSNSSRGVLETVQQMTNQTIPFYEVDIRDSLQLHAIFCTHTIEHVIHCASLKAVGESVNEPLKYYDNNVTGTIRLLEVMETHQCFSILFSSSATVYGTNTYPVKETDTTGIGITNPYGKTKYMIEEILRDLYKKNPEWQIIILRYFNPIGAHPSGLIGENPVGIPNNLFPYILQTAKGIRKELVIYGNDYDTPDGTCLRDYIHVCDLAEVHVTAFDKCIHAGLHIYNVGTGTPTSVLEIVDAFVRSTDTPVQMRIGEKRPGDLGVVYANTDKLSAEFGWKPRYTIEDACQHGWKYINK
jgi:UDP-glucose 4-epimerase